MVFEYLDQDLRKFLDREQTLDVPVIKVPPPVRPHS